MKRLFLLLLFLMVAVRAEGAEITLQQGTNSYSGCDDSTLHYSGEADSNYGNDTTLLFANQSAGWYGSPIFKFNLSGIPSTSTINSATLEIYFGMNDGNAGTASLYRVLKAWTEAGVTGNKWDGTQSWGTQGCENASDSGNDNSGNGSGYDRWATASASYVRSSWEEVGFKSFNITTPVRNWVDGSWGNNGLIMKVSSGTFGDGRVVYSSEHATTSYRPKLTINYTEGSSATPSNKIIIGD